MITPQNIVFACWIIFILYWYAVPRETKQTQETKVNLNTSWWNILGKIFIAFLVIESFTNLYPFYPLNLSIVPQWYVIKIIATVFAIMGVTIAIWARKLLAANWSSNIDIKQGHQLITNGIYAYVRHPIYTGIIIMAFGTFLSAGTISGLLFFLFILFFMLYKAKQEEELLTKHFGNEYTAYKKRVKALIPFMY